MDTKFEVMLNGGADKIHGYDDGEWKEMKLQDEDELYQQTFLKNLGDDEVEIYKSLPENIY